MKKKRIQYNELNEEIYTPKYWTKARLVVIGFILLFLGFMVNFSLEERVNKFLQTKLGQNPSCPIQFEKVELSYLLPKVVMRKPVILGACFGQYNNRLEFQDIKVAFHSPSFYPVGLRLHVEARSGKSYINLYPVISVFSQNVKIEKTRVDTQLFAPMTEANLSPVAGTLSIEGFFEFKSGSLHDGEVDIVSRNFSLPSQNIKGFELTQINLETLNISAKFDDPSNISIERIQIGKNNAPVELNLKGKIRVNEADFMGSMLNLSGNMKLTNYILTNFAFLKLFLPESNTSGNYQLKVNGPLRNPGAPQIL
nr:type II secretion system protein GspN [Bacteriovorax sp. HI3]